jgi:serine/threonine-protein kinase
MNKPNPYDKKNTEVLINSSVDLVVSLGVEIVTVPDVVGLDQGTAETTITSVGLTVGNITGEYIDIVPQGEVKTQSPAPGTTINAGSPVNIHVSLGVWTGVDPPTDSIFLIRIL